ncbi:hypothetical protein IAU60_005369 [Kwoniella sp. DSM 27419]
MPRPPETPDVKASKALAYILRHGAEKEGLHIRSDGYIKLADVLARPKLRGIDLEMVLRLVAENAKQRFQLFYGYDPSPPPPKKKKVQQVSKKKLRAMAAEAESAGGPRAEVDAAQLDDLRSNLAKTSVTSSPQVAEETPPSTELPLVEVPKPDVDEASRDTLLSGEQSTPGEYFIRATQGHSINLESVSHLEEVRDDEDGRRKAGLLVHGTKWELWDVLKDQGLSRMSRQHVHLAPSFQGAIVPRPNSSLYIYLSLTRLVSAGIPVYVSHNGVVLTPGDKDGKVDKEYWGKAVRCAGGKKTVVWEDGKEAERALREDEA